MSNIVFFKPQKPQHIIVRNKNVSKIKQKQYGKNDVNIEQDKKNWKQLRKTLEIMYFRRNHNDAIKNYINF